MAEIWLKSSRPWRHYGPVKVMSRLLTFGIDEFYTRVNQSDLSE